MSLLRAELRKLAGNPMLIGATVWIFPIGIGSFSLIGILLALILPEAARAMATTSSGSWITDAAGIWRFISSFPVNIFGRLLPLAFMATAFAGEYTWGTWRQLLPRSSRWQLLSVKGAALLVLLAASLGLTSVLTVLGQLLLRAALDLNYGPPINAESIAEFGATYGQELLIGLLSLLVLVGMASLAAVVSRSILGGLLASFGLSILEPMSYMIFLLIQRVFDWKNVMELYRLTPTYNLDNIRSWLAEGQGYLQPGAGFTTAPGLPLSLLLMALWIGLLFGISVLLFHRQDISE